MPHPDHYRADTASDRPRSRAERSANALVSQAMDAAQKHDAAILECIERLNAIEHPLGSPVMGYDMDDIVAQLRDMVSNPNHRLEREFRERAADHVVEAA